MATYSGKFSINSAYTLYLDVSEDNYDILTNSSPVSWVLRAHSDKALQYGSWDYTTADVPYSVYIDGIRVASGNRTYDFRNYKDLTIASGTTTVAHNEDGTKIVACSASYCASGSPIGTASVSGNFTLTTIPRASDITCTSPAVMASTQSVVVTQKSTSFSHILYYSTDGGTTYTEIGRDTETETYSWTLPDITSTIPNADNATYILKCETYTNSTYEGTALESTLNIVATVPSSYVPTIALTSITEGNTAIPATFPFLVGFSKLAVRTTFTGSANSTCAGRAVQVGNEIITNTSSTSVVDMQFINALASTSVNVLATTTDSRGRQGTATQAVSAYAYQNPNIAVDLTRADSNGNADPLGEYLQVRAKWFYDGVNNLNSATIKIYLDETLEYTYTPSVSSQTEWTDICLLDDIYASSQFDFVATIEDLLLTASVSQTVSKAILPLSPYDDGTDVGVTIGRMATGAGFRSALDNYFVSGTQTHLMDTDGRQVIKTINTDDLFDGGGGLAKFVKGTPIDLYDTDGETVLYSRNPENLVFYDGESGEEATNNYIWAKPSANKTMTTASTYYSPTFATVLSSKGVGFEISNGDIKCNKNGRVKVTVQLFTSGGSATSTWANISINGVRDSNAHTYNGALTYNNIYLQGVYSVSAGDLINVQCASWVANYTLQNTTTILCEYIEDYYITQAISESNTYSTSEIEIGRWIDGKPIYRKVAYISSLPNNTQGTYNIGISNVDFVIHIYGSTTTGQPMNEARKDPNYSIGAWIENNQLKIESGTNRSSQSAYVVVEYTKTTD